jgi:hypothetical protein
LRLPYALKRRTASWLPFALAAMLLLAGGSASSEDDDDTTTVEAQTIRVTKQFDFGAFCVDNIPVGTVTAVGRPESKVDGIWRDVTLTVPSGDGPKPRVYFLSGIVPVTGIPAACGNTPPAGVTRILEGDLSSGRLKFSVLWQPYAGYSTAETIKPNEMDIVLSRVRLAFAPLYGGQVTAPSVRVSTVKQFTANPGRMDGPNTAILSGTLKVGSQRLEIRRAQVQLPGASQTTTLTFSPGTDGSAILVEIPTGHVFLFAGTQVAASFSSGTADTISAAGVRINLTQWKVTRTTLSAFSGAKPPEMTFHDLALNATQVFHAGAPFADVRPHAPVSVEAIRGALAPDNGVAQIASPSMRNVVVPNGDLQLGGVASAPAISGSGSLKVHEITDDAIDGEIALAAPVLSALNSIAPLRGRALAMHVSGDKTAPKVNGSLGLVDAKLGSLDLSQLDKTSLSFLTANSTTDEWGLQFSVDASASAGHWDFADPTGGSVELEGQLKALKARGTVWFGSSQNAPRIVVDPGTFRLAAEASIVRDSLVFGADASHTQISPSLDITSPSGFAVAKAATSGSADIVAALLVVDQPQLAFEIDNQGRFRVTAPLRFVTGATLTIDLANRGLTLKQGHAEMTAVSANAVDARQSVTLAGIAIKAPSLSLGDLVVDAHDGNATVSLQTLAFQADSLTHASDPGWGATAVSTQIASVAATLGDLNTAIKLKGASLTGLQVAANDGHYTSRDGLDIGGHQMSLRVQEATLTSVVGGVLSIQNGQLAFKSTTGGASGNASASYDAFRVTFNGASDDINGTIHLHVTAINGSYSFSPMSQCPSSLLLSLGVSVSSFNIDGAIQHGDARGTATINDPRIRLTKTSADTCEWNATYNVPVSQVVLLPVCIIPWIGPAICNQVQKTINVNVPVPVRWKAQAVTLDEGIQASDVQVSLAGKSTLSACIRGAKIDLDQLKKVSILTVTPTFEAHGDLADLVKKVWDLAFQITEGLLTTSVLNSLVDLGALFTNIFPVNQCVN